MPDGAPSTSFSYQTPLWPSFYYSTIFLLPSRICSFCIYGIFMIRKWHEVNMERICCLSPNKRCCSSLVMWYSKPLITGTFWVYYWAQQKWKSYTMHIWLYKFIFRIDEAVTINSWLSFALLYINKITKYRLISSVLVSQLVIRYLRIFAVI